MKKGLTGLTYQSIGRVYLVSRRTVVPCTTLTILMAWNFWAAVDWGEFNSVGMLIVVPAVPYIGREAGSLVTAVIETTICQLPRAFPIGWRTKQRWKENRSSNTHTGRHTVPEGTIYFHTVAVESIRGTPADANKVRGAGISHRQIGDGNETERLAKKDSTADTECEHDNMTRILENSSVHATWSQINTNGQVHFLQNCCDNFRRGQDTNEHYCRSPIVSALPSLLKMLKALPW